MKRNIIINIHINGR
ncbi:hypothetical protein F383_15836 [Gossypium arboreum]|uniref:Uncharacterized protein n=1 Tax=Gossypium arboreum TaxID=29729 RepID=A0A0B0PSY5_GOSAR|nr:hypothetical protein F383_15836 [Gossypium arboreum]